jgi:NADPH2:quinone reductase
MNSRVEILSRANEVLKGLQEGWLNLRIDHVLPLEQAAKAQAMLESRQTVGKVILKIGG